MVDVKIVNLQSVDASTKILCKPFSKLCYFKTHFFVIVYYVLGISEIIKHFYFRLRYRKIIEVEYTA